MSVRNQLKLIVGGLSARRGGSRPPHPIVPSAMGECLERSRVVAVLIFIVTVAAIVVISSAGTRARPLNATPSTPWGLRPHTPSRPAR